MDSKTYVALLRGVNVGGNKAVPMKKLKRVLELKGYKNVRTLLASGNVVFESSESKSNEVSLHLSRAFGFSIPVVIVPMTLIEKIVKDEPFENIKSTLQTRFYVTFLPKGAKGSLKVPYKSEDNSFHIFRKTKSVLFSVLDLAKTASPMAMDVLDKTFGKGVTTRNYNTVVKIAKLKNND